MAEYSELETLKANGCDGGNTIRTHFAEIIVRGTADKPYYEILYFDTEDRSCHIGFGSYYLEYVFKWLSEEFETVADWQTADVAPVRHGRWVHDHYENCSEQFEIVKCTNCGHKAYAMAIYVRGGNYCPNCGARMDGDGNDR